MPLSHFLMENPLGLPILPHLRRQISSRIGDYSAKTSSLYLRQARQSLSLGENQFREQTTVEQVSSKTPSMTTIAQNG